MGEPRVPVLPLAPSVVRRPRAINIFAGSGLLPPAPRIAGLLWIGSSSFSILRLFPSADRLEGSAVLQFYSLA